MARGASRRALRTLPRATRAKPTFSYAEPSSDTETESEQDDEDVEFESPRSPSNRRRSSRSQNPTKAQPSPKKRQRSTRSFDSGDQVLFDKPSKKRKQSKPSTPQSTSGEPFQSIQSSGVIPQWSRLPYHILLQVFQYATYPLYDEHFQPLPSASWLLKVARLCRAFAEPALTVLYASPPLVPMEKAHKLVDLLEADPISMAFKYRQKVESLRIDVGQVVAYSLPGSGHLDLHRLIRNLPRLLDLEFYHQKDTSPYRDLDDTIKWNYPENLFDALEYVDPEADPLRGDKTSVCKLRSWRWSSRLAGKVYPIEKIREIHLKPSFSGLRKLAFVNYQVPYVKGSEDPPKHEKILAESLSALKNLEHLIFESSTLVNTTLLPLLPTNLRNLQLINCWNVVADDFADFLLTHGSQLRSLTLNHNQSLSLSFLPTLGIACPKLQVFRMNLTYFQLHSSYRDSDPLYDELLYPGQLPVWPTTLQIIELTQLRKWQTDAAEMFFQSLLDSAASLRDLRGLTIQAILNIGWRDRASFRDKWVGSLDRVFKRVSSPAETHVSLREPEKALCAPSRVGQPEDRFQITAAKLRSPRSSSGSRNPVSTPPPLTSRRSTRISTRQVRTGTYAESSDNSDIEEADSPGPSARDIARSNRVARELAILKQTAGIDGNEFPSSPPQTPESENSDDDVPLAKRYKRKDEKREIIQGMCEVVDVRIDNLRPRETQVTEADFLDEEAPGDGDWNGDDDFEDAGYAW